MNPINLDQNGDDNIISQAERSPYGSRNQPTSQMPIETRPSVQANPEKEQKQHPEPFKLTGSEKGYLGLIFTLYFIEGLVIGFFVGSLPVFLAEEGVSYSQLGLLSFARVFLSMKPLFAPFLDTVYSKTMGRRKTYIIPIQYICAASCYFLSFHMEKLIKELDTGLITFCAVFFVLITAVHEVASSGWSITLVRKDGSSYVSVCTILGNTLGMITSNNLLIQFNSTRFCNKFIYDKPQSTPAIEINDFLFYISIFLVITTLIIHFAVKEAELENIKPRSTLKVMMMIKGFYTNGNLKFLCTFLVIWKVGFSPIECVWFYRMIQKGFPKEIISAIQAFSIPLQVITNMIAGWAARNKNEMRIILFSLFLRAAENMICFMLISNFDLQEDNIDSTTMLLIIFQVVNVIEGGCISVSLGSFFNRIADQSIGGTYISTLQSIFNLGRQWPDIIFLFLNSYVDFTILASVGWLYTALFVTSVSHRFLKLEKLPANDFKLESDFEPMIEIPPLRMTVSSPPRSSLQHGRTIH